jgi:hypothetical protein
MPLFGISYIARRILTGCTVRLLLLRAFFSTADRSADAVLVGSHTIRTAMAYNKQAHHPDASYSYCTNAFRYS